MLKHKDGTPLVLCVSYEADLPLSASKKTMKPIQFRVEIQGKLIYSEPSLASTRISPRKFERCRCHDEGRRAAREWLPARTSSDTSYAGSATGVHFALSRLLPDAH